jgi:hypothetical protein
MSPKSFVRLHLSVSMHNGFLIFLVYVVVFECSSLQCLAFKGKKQKDGDRNEEKFVYFKSLHSEGKVLPQ